MKHLIAIQSHSTFLPDMWGFITGDTFVVDHLDVVVTGDGSDTGTGFFSELQFVTDPKLEFGPTAEDLKLAGDGWENSMGLWLRFYRNHEPVSLADLRHGIRTRYIEASGDTTIDPTPTTELQVVDALREEVTIHVRGEKITQVALRRWPDIDPGLIPATLY